MLLPTFFFLFLLVLLPTTFSSDTAYQSFHRCLSAYPIPANTISSILFSEHNSSFYPLLRAYIRNPRFNTTATRKPTIILAPLHESHVQATVICSTSLGVQLKIRSGGHDFEGISYLSTVPFLLLDLSNLRSISVNISDESAWVQSGATLGELYYNIWKNSSLYGFSAGVCPTVGVGGHVSGGGYGNMLRKHGLTIDNVVDATIVDARGNILDRSAMGEDLFWAIRGGGGSSFCVILAFKLKLVRVPETVTVFRLRKTQEENATEIVHRWQYVADKVDDDLFIRVLLQPVSSKTKKGRKTVRATFIGMFLGGAQRLISITSSDFPELGLRLDDCMEMSWIRSVLYWANYDEGTSPTVLLDRRGDSATTYLKRKSDYVKEPLSTKQLEWLWGKMVKGKAGMVLNPYGGRMSRISSTATAFPHREGNICMIQYSANWREAGKEAEELHLREIRELYKQTGRIFRRSPRPAYLNYRDLDIGMYGRGGSAGVYEEGEVFGRKYFLENFDRLVKVKTEVDPDNYFWNEQSIPLLHSTGRKRI